MPYNMGNGMDKNPTIIRKMEKCVSDIMSNSKFKPYQGRTKKESAIAVCKASMAKIYGKK